MVKALVLSFISRAGTAVLNFCIVVLLSRFLGPEGRGEAARLLVVISGIQIICDFMGGAALVFLSSRYRLRSLLFPAWAFSALCCMTALLAIRLFNEELFNLFGWNIAFLTFIMATFSQNIHLLNGREQFSATALLVFLQALLTFGTLIVALNLNSSVESYMVALYAGYMFTWLIAFFRLMKTRHHKLKTPRPGSVVKTLLRYASLNQSGHLIQFFTQRVAYFFLPLFSLGIYSNAISLSESLWMIASSAAGVQYGRISNSSDKSASVRITLQLFRVVIIATLLGVLALNLLPPSFYGYVFGKEFSELSIFLPILAPGVVAMAGYLIIGHYFSGRGLFQLNNIALISGLIFTVLCYLLIQILPSLIPSGIHAAAITTLSNLLIIFVVCRLFRREAGIRYSELIPRRSDFAFLFNVLRLKRG